MELSTCDQFSWTFDIAEYWCFVDTWKKVVAVLVIVVVILAVITIICSCIHKKTKCKGLKDPRGECFTFCILTSRPILRHFG